MSVRPIVLYASSPHLNGILFIDRMVSPETLYTDARGRER